MTKRTLARYDTLARENQPVDAFCILRHGSLKLTSLGDAKLDGLVLRAGDHLGEPALAANARPRTPPFRFPATATASEPVELLVCARRTASTEPIASLLAEHDTSEKVYAHEMARLLSRTVVFAGFRQGVLHRLSPLFNFEEVEAESTLIQEGSAVGAFYVLIAGSVIVTKKADLRNPHSADVELAIVTATAPMPCFGESSIISSALKAAHEDDASGTAMGRSVSSKLTSAMRGDSVHMVTLRARERRNSVTAARSAKASGAGASVRTLERSRLLSLPRANAPAFLRVLPSFLAGLEERRATLDESNRRQIKLLLDDTYSVKERRKAEGFSMKTRESSVAQTLIELGIAPEGEVGALPSLWGHLADQFLTCER